MMDLGGAIGDRCSAGRRSFFFSSAATERSPKYGIIQYNDQDIPLGQ
jgi:hypothetical protein